MILSCEFSASTKLFSSIISIFSPIQLKLHRLFSHFIYIKHIIFIRFNLKTKLIRTYLYIQIHALYINHYEILSYHLNKNKIPAIH